MSQYFVVANPAKRQYLDPGKFGWNQKRSWMMQGFPGYAVFLLLSDDFAEGGPTGLLGSWVGDPVIAAGDDYGRPDARGIRTSSITEPTRNLNRLAHAEYEDISYQAVSMLSHVGYANELAHHAINNDDALLNFGHVAYALDCRPLKEALDCLDPHWPKRYKAARDQANLR